MTLFYHVRPEASTSRRAASEIRRYSAAATALGVTRPALSALLNERAALSPEMALRFEKAFGVSMDTLLRMQGSHDIARAREREGEIDVRRFEGGPIGLE